jgi:hypothetical protein
MNTNAENAANAERLACSNHAELCRRSASKEEKRASRKEWLRARDAVKIAEGLTPIGGY